MNAFTLKVFIYKTLRSYMANCYKTGQDSKHSAEMQQGTESQQFPKYFLFSRFKEAKIFFIQI